MAFDNHNKNCCYECKDRTVGCHSNCEKYKEYRQMVDEENKAKRKAMYPRGHILKVVQNTRPMSTLYF